ncbi:MAG: TRAP transporter fused permease subunit [Succinivibrio sp.]|nr:TRAP transporter fused permease subunit [Succinivibrio sp.]
MGITELFLKLGLFFGEMRAKYRQFPNATKAVLVLLLCLWTVFQLYYTTLGAISALNLRACHAVFLLLFTFALWPGFSRETKTRRSPPLWDLLLIAASIGTLSYVMLNYPRVAMSGGRLNAVDLWVAGVLLLLVFEAARRACPNLALLAALFLAYNFFGAYLPGALGHNGLTLKRVLATQIWGTQGVLGIGIGVSATYIFVFVLFGAFLKYSGFSKFINDFALALVGQSPGGPAKVAVLASAAMGMVNGSAIANVATTGTITIPLMKETGYRKEFAAAVEAVSSTGGQFCPPIMGAVGFVMAEFLNISYTQVMLAAVVPAVLYYLGLLAAVHFEAKKRGLSGFSREQIPNALKVLREEGHLGLPLVFLIFMMCVGYTPLYAAVLSIAVTVAVSYLKKDTRMSFAQIMCAVVEGARGAISVGICCVIIGVIIGTVTLTSLGLNMGYVILSVVEDGNLMLTGFFTMLMSVILGMGVPGVAAYVIVQAVAVPVLIKVGVVPICAHLFCLIYACLSNITPPVAMSCYVAAGIADSNQLKTGLIAVKLGLIGFIMPFFFLYNPVLLLGVQEIGVWHSLMTAGSAALGTLALASALQGYLLKRLSWPERLLLLCVCPCLLQPGLTSDVCGLVLFVGILLWQHARAVKEPNLNT